MEALKSLANKTVKQSHYMKYLCEAIMLGHQAKLWMCEGKAPHMNSREYIASTSQTFLCKIL